MDLFRSFLIRSRRDIKDIFEQIATDSDMHYWHSESEVASTTDSKQQRSQTSHNICSDHQLSAITSVQSNAIHSDSSIDNNHNNLFGLLARNTAVDRNNADTYQQNSQRVVKDSIKDNASNNASNSAAAVDALKSLLLTATDFHAFIITYQCENLSLDDVKQLIQTHEPSAQLRQNNCLSFEGFARYLMDKDNYAYTPELQPIVDDDMNQPLSHYYMASSHNTYLTGHQLKGESSVELYSQVLLTGCRCVELDCWDGDDGMPVIYHGHTLTSKIAFKKVIETINEKAFISSPYPVMLSIENHCSLQQQQKMAQIFISTFGDKLVTRFLFDWDYSDEPQLPTPNQLKYRILIKNKKLRAPFAPMLSMKTRANTISKSLTSAGRTNSLISNASSGSLNEEEDDEYDEDDDDEETLGLDDITPLAIESSLVSEHTTKNVISKTDSQSSQDSNSAHSDHNKMSHNKGFGYSSPGSSTRPRSQSEDRISGELCNESAAHSAFYRNKAVRKSSSQLAPELSDLVIYCQAIKFRSFISSAASPTNQTIPSSVIKKITTRKQGVTSVPISSTHTSFTSIPSTSSVPAVAELSRDTISHSPTLLPTTSGSISSCFPLNKRPTVYAPCFQISSVNENTAKKLCRKNPLSLIAHTESQIMRTYPARMRIDSSNFNPVIFWAFGFQSVALNYQTVDTGLHINTAMFEQNGGCGLVLKPSVMRDKCHMMYGRFNPWVKELDGFYAINLTITIISGQYVCPNLNTGSPQVEIEIIGIPIDCNRQRTKVIQRNAINPIWNDTFLFRVCFRDLAFLRFAVTDLGANHLTAQRVVPFNCLKQGYRHLKLKSVQNQILPLSTLFMYTSWETDGLDMTTSASEDNVIGVQSSSRQKIDLNRIDSREIIGSAPVRRRMFFLVVHGVLSDEPTTILKVTQESTSSDVITQALTKANKAHESTNDYVLIEEVQRGWHKKTLFNRNTTTQRILDCDERPLEAQSMWKGKGRFILKKIADNHCNRASLPNIRRINRQDTDSELNAEWNEDPESNTFLVCIYNVSADQPHIILKANICSRSQDIIAQALLKARRLENASDFAIIEELDNYSDIRFDAASICNKLKGSKSFFNNNNTSRRVLEDNENIYSVQSKWKTKGKFELKHRNDITSGDMTLNRSKGSLKKLSEFHRSLSKKILRKDMSSASPIATCSAPQSLVSSSCLESCGSSESPLTRQIHSEGEMTSDNEEKKSASQMSRLKKLSIRRLKVWL